MQQHRVHFQTYPNIVLPKKNVAYFLELLSEEATIIRKLEIAASGCQIWGPSKPSVKRILKEAKDYRLRCLRPNVYPLQQGLAISPRSWDALQRGVGLVRYQSVEYLSKHLEYIDDVAFV
jgi:hypothetical protein